MAAAAAKFLGRGFTCYDCGKVINDEKSGYTLRDTVHIHPIGYLHKECGDKRIALGVTPLEDRV